MGALSVPVSLSLVVGKGSDSVERRKVDGVVISFENGLESGDVRGDATEMEVGGVVLIEAPPERHDGERERDGERLELGDWARDSGRLGDDRSRYDGSAYEDPLNELISCIYEKCTHVRDLSVVTGTVPVCSAVLISR